MTKKSVTILGASGSVGQSTLAVLDEHPDQFKLFAISAKKDIETIFNLCLKYHPEYAVIVTADHAIKLESNLAKAGCQTRVLAGEKSLEEVARDESVDIVVASIVGAAGLAPTLAAVRAGKRILLANKESLVMAGDIFMQAVHAADAELLPIDSEHNAIFQCLQTHSESEQASVEKIILTASGGALRDWTVNELKDATPEQACNHPNWSMGQKISIDSASLMNKGLELIEAHWLFDVSPSKLDVLIHPQSIVHSLVEFCDGSVLAQLSYPDMRVPIAYGLNYPNRLKISTKALDLLSVRALTFEPPDEERFPCLKLAKQVMLAGGTAPTILNAANEIAVEAFIAGRIGFLGIPNVIHHVLDRLDYAAATDLEDILERDRLARELSKTYLDQLIN